MSMDLRAIISKFVEDWKQKRRAAWQRTLTPEKYARIVKNHGRVSQRGIAFWTVTLAIALPLVFEAISLLTGWTSGLLPFLIKLDEPEVLRFTLLMEAKFSLFLGLLGAAFFYLITRTWCAMIKEGASQPMPVDSPRT